MSGVEELPEVDLDRLESLFPIGTPVCVRQTIHRRGRDTITEMVGVVASWDVLPTGSWFAHGKNQKLWLTRLTVRKADGEITLVVIDDATEISRLEPARA